MGNVKAASTILIEKDPATVLSAVADYRNVRPKILSSHYRDYQVLEGGQGQGTVASWKLQATESRVRDVKASVDVAGHAVIEKDANSTLVTNWTVERDAHEVMETLQRAGVAAGVVHRAVDDIEDPQLKWLDAIIELDHPVAGKRLYPNVPFKEGHFVGVNKLSLTF